MSSWHAVLKAIQLKPRYLFGVAASCGVLVALPDSWLEELNMANIIPPVRGWLVLVGIVSSCLGVAQLMPGLQRLWRRRKAREATLRALESLSAEEEDLLAYCVHRNRRTLLLRFATQEAHVAAGLCQKGLMVHATGLQDLRSLPFTIPPFVWDALQVRFLELLDPDAHLNADLREEFERLDRLASGARVRR